MSSRQRKRRGGAPDYSRARKRSRLLPSSTGGMSHTEPIDFEESGTLSFEPAGGEIIDLTGESSEREVIIISDDESAVERDQSQQLPHLSRAPENPAEPLARDNEEEPRENDGAWPGSVYSSPLWLHENSWDWEQSQQYSHLSRSSENSAGLLTTGDKEEPRDNDGACPAGPASPPAKEDDNSGVQDRKQSQQYPLGSRSAENSAEPWASDNEEESRDNDDEWPGSLLSPPTMENDDSESLQYPLSSRAAEDAADVLANENEEEPRDIELYVADKVSLQVYKQQRRNVNSHTQVNGSGIGTGAKDAHVAGSAPAEQGATEEEAACSDSVSSSAQPGVVIRCPICMEFYSEIMQSGRLIVATMCGHIFCSACLPVALETIGVCPTCRAELTPEMYIPIYL